MRVLLIRHGQSQNNVLSDISYESYYNSRSCDAYITEEGEKQATLMGNYLKENNIKIDKFYTSASRRTLATLKFISKIYDESNNIPVELFVDIHEYGGVHIDEVGFKGMNEEEIKSNMEGIIIPNDPDVKDGWWKSESKETDEMFKERVKRATATIKDIAMINDDDFTICLVTHGIFLNGFFSILLNCELLNENLNFGFDNLSLSSLTFNKKREFNVEFVNLPLMK